MVYSRRILPPLTVNKLPHIPSESICVSSRGENADGWLAEIISSFDAAGIGHASIRKTRAAILRDVLNVCNDAARVHAAGGLDQLFLRKGSLFLTRVLAWLPSCIARGDRASVRLGLQVVLAFLPKKDLTLS